MVIFTGKIIYIIKIITIKWQTRGTIPLDIKLSTGLMIC